MHPTVNQIEREQQKTQVPDFRAGDTVRVAVRITEGEKTRIQNFEGVCITRRGGGVNETFTVRRVSFGIGMERVFAMHSPRIESIKVLRHGQVRRSKLYYLRDLSGRKARIGDTRRKRGARDRMVQLLEAEGAFDQPTAEEQRDAEIEHIAETDAAPATE